MLVRVTNVSKSHHWGNPLKLRQRWSKLGLILHLGRSGDLMYSQKSQICKEFPRN